jgi:hypothetical protein
LNINVSILKFVYRFPNVGVFGLEQESIIGILHKFLSHGLILLFQGKIEIDFLGFGFPIIDDSTVTQPLI